MIMKVAFLVLSVIVAASASPAGREAKEEVEFVPLEKQFNPHIVPVIVDTGIIGGGGSPWLSGFGPFEDLLGSISGIMESMRNQMNYLLNRFPVGNSTSVDFPFSGFDGIDLSKANTTSVTKIIDGHKVVINETEYKNEGDDGGAIFNIRIIDVVPDSSELTTEKNSENIPTVNKDVEPLESSVENEIPKNHNEDTNAIEAFEEPDAILSQTRQELPEFQNRDDMTQWSGLEPLETFDDNTIEYAQPPPDFNRDTYVNQILADSGAPLNPDAEFIDFIHNPKTPFEKFVVPR